ncbi:zinc-finger homeodomain protein 9-like [Punica granatum]|uniref:ZF-HD dimerization-type domain-containing protein n=2 Tax=Punica granatum TaxID=22663 RepID=A0A218VQP6_PUNGR|nr:zinc-finger homeodomain protein 9-like [Punica granatum]OWM62663.1 hypothetical protein CDL15_Pgr019957 [Punica granatum]PKI53488.1 hypothetical protein CRG98_026178 [Punica granatum]
MEGEREVYRECLRNHAASLGSYATDGCGEFTLDDSSSSPGGSLHCAACGCHRNFHRKVTTYAAAAANEGGGGGGRGLLVAAPGAFSSRRGDQHLELVVTAAESPSESDRSGGGGSKKRFRTKFTPEQKEKMLEFAEKLGWKLQRKDLEDEIERFCRSVGVSRQVFKVWMHNHKNSSSSSASTGNASSLTG